MDFYKISIKELKDGTQQLYPDWQVARSEDLMVRGHSFYAVWDEAAGLWSTDEYDVQRLVDEDLIKRERELYAETGMHYQVMSLRSAASTSWAQFKRYLMNLSDNSHPLDSKLTFANTEVKKEDYVSHRLSYSLEPGAHDAWDSLVDVLYSPAEKEKIEWAIGAVVSGDSRFIQKFLVFYGPAGTGKSTVLDIIQRLFDGYTSAFDAKALGGTNNTFATDVFRKNPLVAIQHDGDLSRIEDNTKLNSIVSHEDMTMNEKFKSSYDARVNAFLFLGTNKPVKITDAKSGLIRRLIDVHPTGTRHDEERYHTLIEQVGFELGAIANHCLQEYRRMGKNYFSSYRPKEMMAQTDVFYNFVEAHFDIFKAQGGVSLSQAWDLYKVYCEDTGIEKKLPQFKMRAELSNYFERYQEQAMVNGVRMRSYYSGFKSLAPPNVVGAHDPGYLDIGPGKSQFDADYQNQPAQYTTEDGNPKLKWANVKTTLADLDTKELHFVKVPEEHIVIDFDLVNEDGEKDLQKNLRAASKWPATYAEVSKSGHGLHLHYIYHGDVHELASVYDVGIEVKTLLGDSSLRRKLTMCNDHEISVITSGLPKKEKPMLDVNSVQTEKGLRALIERNLRKEIHPGTKSSVDFIAKILDDAYASGIPYDVRDMRQIILTFAMQSTHQSAAAIKTVQKMQFVSEQPIEEPVNLDDKPLVFFDVEVYPNLFVVCWKYAGSSEVVRMINPTPQEIEPLLGLKLVGFNNRRYDNHIIYARYLGYPNDELYYLSQRIIVASDRSAMFGEAYNLSYADIYDFSSKKQGLKKFQIELGLKHLELDIPWDKPVDESLWPQVVDYCCNDVTSTEVVFESRKQDFVAREILASLSGLPINATTQNHTAMIIFGPERNPQTQFVYTDLSVMFPGYSFSGKDSTYRGEITGEGGYVYAEPGMYENVALLDVASMHPTSIEELNAFGPYTSRYSELKIARMAIKHKEYEKARELLGGKLRKHLDGAEDDPIGAEALSYALKIVINIVYGLTSAKFPNQFRDNRNKDNIVAKRGALFMIDLKHAVQEKGFQVVHIKTDSIKIPNATPDIVEFITEFGKKYGYDFEHEGTYDKFCLVNDAVYIAREGDRWTAVGAEFQKPYVFKSLFSHEPLEFSDYCETKNVMQGVMYLDFDRADHELDIKNMVHIGRTGSFIPVKNGGTLYRVKDGKFYAVTGTKGYRWIERDTVSDPSDIEIDMEYFENLKAEALSSIETHGSYEGFIS